MDFCFCDVCNILENILAMLKIRKRYKIMPELGRYYSGSRTICLNPEITVSWAELTSTFAHEVGHGAHDVVVGFNITSDIVKELVADKFCYRIFEAYGLEVPNSRENHFMAALLKCSDEDDYESDEIVGLIIKRIGLF